jgi:nucleotide-binding universal stress UspA family protein
VTDVVYDPQIDGVAVGHDGSAAADAALLAAAAEARLRGCRLHVIRAWSVTTAPRPPEVPHGIVPSVAQFAGEVEHRLAETTARLLGTGSAGETTAVLHAPQAGAADALIAASTAADLVVVGSRGLGGVSGLLLGSTSEQVVRHAHCPVLVVRGAR